ncbi:MAG: hypothetical protein RMM53_10200 [Bacteroidia bacterium]|nr:hypothetical protein [Bacteroidia bacterium]MDW8334574.1 hypothetical protein [Bacteroidia bacterium]
MNKMKRFLNTRSLIVPAVLIAALMLNACGGDEAKDEKPKITLSSTGNCVGSDKTYELDADAQASFKICGVATKGPDGKKLEKFRITVSYDGGAALALLDTTLGSANDETYNFEYAVTTRKADSETGKTEKYTVIVTDKAGLQGSASFTITVKRKAGPPPIQRPRAITGVTFTNTNAFFVSKDGITAIDASAADSRKSEVDLTYLYSSATQTHSFIDPNHRSTPEYDGYGAPAAIPFDCPTVTNFYSLTGSPDYNAISNASQDTLATIVNAGTLSQFTGNPPGKRIQISSGTAFGFKNTATNKFGIVWVKSLGANSCAVDILVQN